MGGSPSLLVVFFTVHRKPWAAPFLKAPGRSGKVQPTGCQKASGSLKKNNGLVPHPPPNIYTSYNALVKGGSMEGPGAGGKMRPPGAQLTAGLDTS